jgi:hypothetical protein
MQTQKLSVGVVILAQGAPLTWDPVGPAIRGRVAAAIAAQVAQHMLGPAVLVIVAPVAQRTMGPVATHTMGPVALVIEAPVATHTMGPVAAPARLSVCVKSSINRSDAAKGEADQGRAAPVDAGITKQVHKARRL